MFCETFQQLALSLRFGYTTYSEQMGMDCTVDIFLSYFYFFTVCALLKTE